MKMITCMLASLTITAPAFAASSAKNADLSDTCYQSTNSTAIKLMNSKGLSFCRLGSYKLSAYSSAMTCYDEVVIYDVDCGGDAPRKLVVTYCESNPSCPAGNAWLSDDG
jgi:hypothetical protein